MGDSQSSMNKIEATLTPVFVLGVLALVVGVIDAAVLIYFALPTVNLASALVELVNQGGAAGIGAPGSQADEIIKLMNSLGLPQVDNASALAAAALALASFLVLGAILALGSILGAVGLIRVRKHPTKGYRTVIIALLCGVVALLTLRIVSGLLFIAAALVAHRAFSSSSDPQAFGYYDRHHLGFMRFIEFFCAVNIVANACVLLFVTHSSYYDAAYWVSFIQMLMMSVTLWLIITRKQHGREIILAMVVVYMVIDAAIQVATGHFSLNTYIGSVIPNLLLLLYFGFSKRAKELLVQPFRAESRQATLREDEKLWNLKSPLFWRNLVLYFCIFSVVGHWMEYCVCWLIRLGLVPGTYDPNSGIWHDMLNPFFVYGAAFVVIGLLLFPIKNLLQAKLPKGPWALIVSFLVNTAVCAAIELILGFTCNVPVDGVYPLWDYSDMAFNFMGQICLLNTTFFGFMATLMTWLVYPAMEKLFAKIPKDIMNIITVVVIVFFVLVVFMYVINLSLPAGMEI